jgi:uncharacterized protein (TIGR00730 family)
MVKKVCVFCGSSLGTNPIFKEKAYELGKYLAENDIELVYGGSNSGTMGIVADGVLNHGGKVTGVLPHFLRTKETEHTGLTEIIMTETMHERKMKMYELSDAVITLPGGYGTMDELFEFMTWGQLGLHQKPVALFNVDGFYDDLLSMINKMVENGFLKDIYQTMVIVGKKPEEIISQMNNYQAPEVEAWLTKERV